MNNMVVSEFEVDGKKYQVGRMDAMKQFHVARRLGPALVIAGVSIEMARKGLDGADALAMAGPVMTTISKMADEDVDYVLFTCLGVVKRQEGDKWAPVLTQDGKTLMFSDLELPQMLRIVIGVLEANLANFLKAVPDVKS
jgi:hypothetical protein